MNSEAPQEPRPLEQPVSFVEVQEAWHEMMGPIPDTVGTSRWHRVSSVGARVGSLFGFSSESGQHPGATDRIFRVVHVEGDIATVRDVDGEDFPVEVHNGRLSRAKEYAKDHTNQGIASGVLSAAIGGLFVAYQSKNRK